MSVKLVLLAKRVFDPDEAKQLRAQVDAGEVSLDWRDVEEAATEFCRVLLGDTPLGELPDGIGMDTMSAALAAAVSATRRKNDTPTKPKKSAKPARRRPTPTVTPAIWRDSPGPSKLASKPPGPQLTAIESAELRAELERRMLADLLGPAGGPEEEIQESRLSDRYLVGLLAPSRRRVRVGREQADTIGAGAETDGDDGDDEDEGLAADTMFPSSIGLSFSIEPGARLRIEARWGRYRKVKRVEDDEANEPVWVWRREPMGGVVELEVVQGDLGPSAPDAREPKVQLRGRTRVLPNGQLIVSIFLLNGQDEPEEKKDEGWVFQPEITIASANGKFFIKREGGNLEEDKEPERAQLNMGYRDRIELATGHNAGVSWTLDDEDPTRAVEVRTAVVPTAEVRTMAARMPADVAKDAGPHVDAELNGLTLDMKELAETPRGALAARLQPLVHAYDRWIASQRARLAAGQASGLAAHKKAAGAALLKCEQARDRIQEGIDLCASNEQAYAAFSFANRAMWLQRVHGALAQKRRRAPDALLVELDLPKQRTWRTFQLAFVLINLASLLDLEHPDRSPDQDAGADLLWFPTGGGKTEAYLGLTAFTLAIRRLQGEVGGRTGAEGVTVLMRYTLRLLTLQQFQRATALICACEEIRREALETGDARWGKTPFRIGLWVGGRSTPNRTEQAAEALKQVRKVGGGPQANSLAGLGSPVQLKSCPWCGASIDAGSDMHVETYQGGRCRTLVFCGDKRGECLFSPKRSPGEGLPVLVVDEEIYRKLPSLLIATVDKFAQMPWKGPVGMLFGQVDGVCDRHGFRSPDLDDSDSHPKKDKWPPVKSRKQAPLRPPDLIIQDELHLISGPLGTLTALYETAIDELCTWAVNGKQVRPKVIASTATVRRAAEQVRGLFLREVHIFPPPGLDAGDNFFAVERKAEEVPGRRYIGICAPGRRLKLALIRVYSAALSAAQSLFDEHGAHADPWMTLVGYFGSLRELGGMRRLVDDDVSNRVYRIGPRGLAQRKIGSVKELTSRLGSTEIPNLLEQLEVGFEPKGSETREARRRAIDVLLATNMISVGVDVPRLGLMVCCGQPKTTAEYIQATSRVGREHPGLVLTVYNWARPRDMSHYERFCHYHETFYQHVEANSVTPFSPRALDRGLAAVLVALVRQRGMGLNSNATAQAIDPNHAEIRNIVARIAKRASLIENKQEVEDEVAGRLNALLDVWKSRAKHLQGGAKLGYAGANDSETVGLLDHAGRGQWSTFTCLDSLRDVEASVALVLDEGNMDAPRPTSKASAS